MAAICVYCTSSTRAPQRYIDVAAQLGTALAERGHSLVSGGGDISAMGAVARAAREGGAKTIGVIPERLLEWEVGDQDADELLVVADMRIRKGEMENRSDAFIALPGGLGTLEELIEVWVGNTLGFHAKPVVALDPDDLYDGLRTQVTTMVERGLVRPEAAAALQWATTVGQALDLVEAGIAAAPDPVVPNAEELLEATESDSP
jgi:uncharacterized protein (TIGR00730 family)